MTCDDFMTNIFQPNLCPHQCRKKTCIEILSNINHVSPIQDQVGEPQVPLLGHRDAINT